MTFDIIKESSTNVVKTSYGLLIYRCALIVSRDEESCLLSGGFGKPESCERGGFVKLNIFGFLKVIIFLSSQVTKQKKTILVRIEFRIG